MAGLEGGVTEFEFIFFFRLKFFREIDLFDFTSFFRMLFTGDDVFKECFLEQNKDCAWARARTASELNVF